MKEKDYKPSKPPMLVLKKKFGSRKELDTLVDVDENQWENSDKTAFCTDTFTWNSQK